MKEGEEVRRRGWEGGYGEGRRMGGEGRGGKREEGRGKREEGRGKREEGRGKREDSEDGAMVWGFFNRRVKIRSDVFNFLHQ